MKRGKRKIITLDMETDPFMKGREPEVFLACIYDGDEYYLFADLDKMPRSLSRKGIIPLRNLPDVLGKMYALCYAHNGGRFDYHFLKDDFNQGSKVMIIAGRIGKGHIGNCELRDSYNIFPQALASWQKDDISYDIFEDTERYKPKNWERIVEYQKSDCRHLRQMVLSIHKVHGLHLTVAGACISKLNKIKPLTNHNLSSFYDKFKPYYVGGRVQCFEYGEIHHSCNMYDINSAYPWAMAKFEHPYTDNYCLSSKPIPEELLGPNFMEIDAISYGALPFRNEKGELTFPCDDEVRFFTVCGYEIAEGLRTSTLIIKRVRACYTFKEVGNFSDYIIPLWEARLECRRNGDEQGEQLYKLLMNNLYGKLAADPRRYSEYMVFANDIARSIGHPKMRKYSDLGFYYNGSFGVCNSLIACPLPKSQHRFYNVAAAASITSKVRSELYRNLLAADTPLYCDTDSIVAKGVDNIALGNELGEWGIDGEFDKGYIGGKKLYAFHLEEKYYKKMNRAKKANRGKKISHWKKACKGVDLSHGEIIKVCKGQTVLSERDAPTYRYNAEAIFIGRHVSMTKKHQGKVGKQFD